VARAVAFLDASVLYPAPLRDLLLELAVSDLYRAKWSDAVPEEWIDALLRQRLRNPPRSAADYLATLKARELPAVAAEIAPYADFI